MHRIEDVTAGTKDSASLKVVGFNFTTGVFSLQQKLLEVTSFYLAVLPGLTIFYTLCSYYERFGFGR